MIRLGVKGSQVQILSARREGRRSEGSVRNFGLSPLMVWGLVRGPQIRGLGGVIG
jgi:hypothetical protein